MPGRTDSRVRLLALLCVFLVGALALGARAAYWQVVDHERLVSEAADQTTITIDTPSQRGDIFDRTGTVVLATTVQRERLVAAPDQLTPDQRRATVAELTRLLGLDDAAAIALRDRLASQSRYLVIQHGIDRQLGDRIQAAIDSHEVFGLALEQEPERVYPQPGGGPGTTLAAHLLGFVNRDGVGQYGVEQQYQATLGGTPRVVIAQRDPTGRPMLESADVTSPGVSGTDLRLTIDAGLQLSVEQELLAAWIADKAKRVSAVVMDPYTGEVYAMASYPSFDANDINPLVASVYEPGSVFKMMTAAAALEAGTVTPSTEIKDTGTLRLDGGRTKVDDADRKGMGWMTFQDGVAYSRNVVAAKVALGLGKTTKASATTLHGMWTRLGFGKPTGIDVAGEVAGIVRDPAITPWREIDLANGAFGQGVAVTLLSGSLSKTLVKMMQRVIAVVPFYHDRTIVPGYDVGGKTGTAQIWDPKADHGRGAWKQNLFNYSFVGFIAREQGIPDLVVAIQIEEGTPTVARVGHLEMPVMSFELFRRIATDGITTPDLLTDRPVTPAPAGLPDR